MVISNLAQFSNMYQQFDSLMIINRDGIIEYVGRPDKTNKALVHEEYIGKSLLEIYPDLRRETSTVFRAMDTGMPVEDEFQTIVDKSGNKLRFISSTYPIELDGKIIGAIDAGVLADDDGNPIDTAKMKARKYDISRSGNYTLEDIITCDENFMRIKDQIRKIAKTDMHIGEMFKLIFGCAFNTNAFFGALWGQSIMWGVRRGIYSNEAGMGSGAHASAAAEVSHPAKQGLAQAFSVYVDTIFVCTATAIMLLSTNCYNVQGIDGNLLVENLKGVDPGVGYTQAAINTFLPGLGSAFLAVAVFFFAFTTLLSFAFYADANVTYLCKRMKNQANVRKIVMEVLQ